MQRHYFDAARLTDGVSFVKHSALIWLRAQKREMPRTIAVCVADIAASCPISERRHWTSRSSDSARIRISRICSRVMRVLDRVNSKIINFEFDVGLIERGSGVSLYALYAPVIV